MEEKKEQAFGKKKRNKLFDFTPAGPVMEKMSLHVLGLFPHEKNWYVNNLDRVYAKKWWSDPLRSTP